MSGRLARRRFDRPLLARGVAIETLSGDIDGSVARIGGVINISADMCFRIL
jgi:hypothetical protein